MDCRCRRRRRRRRCSRRSMMARPTKAFLGIGWRFPVKPIGGRFQFAKYEDDVEQAIQIILLSERRERPMLPDAGAGLRRYLFEPHSPPPRHHLPPTGP